MWEVVDRLRQLPGGEEQRIATLAEETDLHPRHIRLALDYAAQHPEDVEARIGRNERARAELQEAAARRRALLR